MAFLLPPIVGDELSEGEGREEENKETRFSGRATQTEEHVTFLLQAAASYAACCPTLSRQLLHDAHSVCQKHSLRMHPDVKWSACKSCFSFYLPWNSSVRLLQQKVPLPESRGSRRRKKNKKPEQQPGRKQQRQHIQQPEHQREKACQLQEQQLHLQRRQQEQQQQGAMQHKRRQAAGPLKQTEQQRQLERQEPEEQGELQHVLPRQQQQQQRQQQKVTEEAQRKQASDEEKRQTQQLPATGYSAGLPIQDGRKRRRTRRGGEGTKLRKRKASSQSQRSRDHPHLYSRSSNSSGNSNSSSHVLTSVVCARNEARQGASSVGRTSEQQGGGRTADASFNMLQKTDDQQPATRRANACADDIKQEACAHVSGKDGPARAANIGAVHHSVPIRGAAQREFAAGASAASAAAASSSIAAPLRAVSPTAPAPAAATPSASAAATYTAIMSHAAAPATAAVAPDAAGAAPTVASSAASCLTTAATAAAQQLATHRCSFSLGKKAAAAVRNNSRSSESLFEYFVEVTCFVCGSRRRRGCGPAGSSNLHAALL